MQIKVNEIVGVNSAKYPGWWTITHVSTSGRKLITVEPCRERGNTARRGVRIPPEMLSDEQYDPFAQVWIDEGAVIAFKASVVARKPDFAGLWVVVGAARNGDTYSVHRLGGSTDRIRGANPATFDVIALSAVPTVLAEFLATPAGQARVAALSDDAPVPTLTQVPVPGRE